MVTFSDATLRDSVGSSLSGGIKPTETTDLTFSVSTIYGVIDGELIWSYQRSASSKVHVTRALKIVLLSLSTYPLALGVAIAFKTCLMLFYEQSFFEVKELP